MTPSLLPLHFFLPGLAVGLLSCLSHSLWRLLVVPLAYLSGLPLPAAVGCGIVCEAIASLRIVAVPELTWGGLFRTGFTVGLFSLPPAALSLLIMSRMAHSPLAPALLLSFYLLLLSAAGGSALGRLLHYHRWGYGDDNAPPPRLLTSLFPLAFPGAAVGRYLTLPRLLTVSCLIGFAGGFFGASTVHIFEPLAMYILGLSRRQAAATALLVTYITSTALLLIYLPVLYLPMIFTSHFPFLNLGFGGIIAGFIAGCLASTGFKRHYQPLHP